MASRWEWRTFDAEFGSVEARLRSAASLVRWSDETYILGEASHENVRVRDGLLDIKTLDETRPDGLQLWRPVLKATFPLEASTMQGAFDRLRVSAPPLHRPRYTAEQWLSEVVVGIRGLTTAHVSKERHGSILLGCTVELAMLSIAGLAIKTVGIEMEDPTAVLNARRVLGLDDRSNEDYVMALKRAAGGSPIVSRSGATLDRPG